MMIDLKKAFIGAAITLNVVTGISSGIVAHRISADALEQPGVPKGFLPVVAAMAPVAVFAQWALPHDAKDSGAGVSPISLLGYASSRILPGYLHTIAARSAAVIGAPGAWAGGTVGVLTALVGKSARPNAPASP